MAGEIDDDDTAPLAVLPPALPPGREGPDQVLFELLRHHTGAIVFKTPTGYLAIKCVDGQLVDETLVEGPLSAARLGSKIIQILNR